MAGPDRDEESGQFTDEYPREDFTHAIEAEGGFAGTSDIADHVGCIRETAYKKLKQVETDGLVEGRKVGTTLVWQLAEAGDE